MRLKLHLLATVFAVSAPCVASAQMFNMPNGYVGAAGGWNMLYNSKIEDGLNLKADFNDGWAALGMVGAKFDNGLRGELELGYRTNEIDRILGTTAGSGDANTWTIMGNVLYEFMNTTQFVPYLGLGAGAARIEYDGVAPIGAGRIDDDTWAPAAQGIVGVSYKFMEKFSVFANYQYLRAFNVDLRSTTGTKTDIDYDASTVLLGVSYTFGAPKEVAQAEPAPEPAPMPQAEQAPATPNSYLVFFDFDRATVTEEARQILRTAAENARTSNATRIEITGHADRAGSDAYNMNLSKRRAENVKKELVRLGLPTNEISVNARGEADPLVPTEDGVREPQNRRVEIVYGQ